MASFKQSIIIPLSLFEKCNFIKDKTDIDPFPQPGTSGGAVEKNPTDILYNKDLPVDIKMKLYAQKKNFFKEKTRKPYPVIIDDGKKENISSKKNDISSIRRLFNTADQPAINSILENILDKPSKVKWDDKYQIIIDGVLIPESNLIDLLKYIRNESVITSEEDIPVGARKFVEVLDLIKVPRSWLKIPRRSGRNQVGSWVSYRDGV